MINEKKNIVDFRGPRRKTKNLSKRRKFEIFSEVRMPKLLNSMRSVKNLSNKDYYEYNDAEKRKILFKGYQINKHLFEKSKNDSMFLHCLPAHRGEEVDSDVIDGPRSKVWQQAHNRLYTSKALIEFLLQESKN